MAEISALVNLLARFWRHTRTRLPYIFICICVLGSILKTKRIVPESFFSNSNNVFKIFFVNVSGGWTIVLLLPFIAHSNKYNRSSRFVFRRMTSLLVATLVMHFCTEVFFNIENVTGSCYDLEATQFLHYDKTKAECKNAGFIWDGFAISSDCFILTYSTLVIVEEMVSILHIPNSYRDLYLNCLYIALNVIVAIWLLMFTCTSLYFDFLISKLLGTLVGILGWYVTYCVWYPKWFSPGLPP